MRMSLNGTMIKLFHILSSRTRPEQQVLNQILTHTAIGVFYSIFVDFKCPLINESSYSDSVRVFQVVSTTPEQC